MMSKINFASPPLASANSKRELSSPDDLTDDKRNKKSDSVEMTQTDLNVSQVSLANKSNVIHRVNLSQCDPMFVFSQLSETLQNQMQTMLQSLVSAIVPEIVKKV